MSCENKIETTQMRSNANPTLTQMRESGELDEASNSTSASTSSEGGLTNVQSGAIGAMVSLVALLVVMFAFQLFGFLTVGKRQIRAQRQGDDNAVSLLKFDGKIADG
jgi:predicted metalloprotease